MRKFTLFALLGLIITLYSCRKTENIENIDHQNVVIDNNNPPAYAGVTTIQVQAYINRAFIDLIGREPNQNELNSYTQTLKNNNLDSASRANMLSDIIGNGEYYDYFHKTNMQRFLGEYDSARIEDDLGQMRINEQNAQASGNIPVAQYFGYEIYRLTQLKNAKVGYQNGGSINDYLSKFVNVQRFDDINMGSLNFVIACFEAYLKRLPTDYESDSGVDMCNGTSAYLFLEDGLSKGDFIRIMCNSDGFYEGLVLDIYLQMLARRPSSTEMAMHTLGLKNGQYNYQTLQRTVAITDEYADF